MAATVAPDDAYDMGNAMTVCRAIIILAALLMAAPVVNAKDQPPNDPIPDLEIRKEIETTKDGRSVKVRRPSSVLYKFPLKGRGQPDCTTAKITIGLKDGIIEIEENIVHGPPRRQSMANMTWHYSLGGGECRINIYIGTHEYKIIP